jgi:hypothetical protein
MPASFEMEYLKETGGLEEVAAGKRIILKWSLKYLNGRAWTAFIWLKIWKSGWFLWKKQ